MIAAMFLVPVLAGAPSLAGSWARLEVTHALSKIPVGEITTKTSAILLLTVAPISPPDGERFEVQAQVCTLETEALGGVVATRYPRGFLDALSGGRAQARVSGAQRAIYSEERPVRTIGADVAPGEALPALGSDPRVVDADRDGHPGITVEISGLISGSVYVVHRDRSALSGRFVDEDRIAGTIRWSTQQAVLGATKRMLGDPPPTRPKRERGANRFWMHRVPAGSTCETVLARREALFP